MDFLTPEVFASVGVPTAICGYLLVKLDKTMQGLTAQLSSNNILIRALLIKMGVNTDVVEEVKP